MPGYNKEQFEAISHTDGPMMVLAGPGCGKTTVITYRLARLIENGTDPSSILVVTFTKAAADEMRTRFFAMRKDDGAAPDFGTLHSVFFHILRCECRLDAHCIVGEDFKLSLIKNILEGRSKDRFAEDEQAVLISREISLIKGNGIASKNFYSSAMPHEEFRAVYAEYRRWMNENRRLDFDDIITAAYRLFKEKPGILKRWQAKYRYILVDEFQDVSPLQYMVVKMLAGDADNLFIVGDDDQSIYRFRGAQPSIMLNFPKEHKDCKIVRLSRNYRSTPQIIAASTQVIRLNKKRFDKELRTKNAAGGPVNIRVFENSQDQGAAISKSVRKHHDSGAAYSSIAVLVRTNALARTAIERFIADRVPFEAAQEIPCIYDHFISKDIFAYLNLASGGTRRDLLRIINKPNRYITKNAIYENRVSFESIYAYYEDRSWMWPRIEALEESLHALKDMPPYGAVMYIRKVIDYDEYIRSYALENKIPPEELMEVADELTESARGYESLAAWRAAATEYSARVKASGGAKSGADGVVISTLHGSKGREYDIVFIMDVNDGIIPYRKAAAEADIEEERRLLYVGMTRARRQLNLFAVKSRYEKEVKLSPFLKPLLNN